MNESRCLIMERNETAGNGGRGIGCTHNLISSQWWSSLLLDGDDSGMCRAGLIPRDKIQGRWQLMMPVLWWGSSSPFWGMTFSEDPNLQFGSKFIHFPVLIQVGMEKKLFWSSWYHLGLLGSAGVHGLRTLLKSFVPNTNSLYTQMHPVFQLIPSWIFSVNISKSFLFYRNELHILIYFFEVSVVGERHGWISSSSPLHDPKHFPVSWKICPCHRGQNTLSFLEFHYRYSHIFVCS